jgi:PAS domain-containing protein
MNTHDLVLAVLLPVPPWIGFLLYRYRGQVGISYGYFLGGILAVLSLPWPQLGGQGLPSAHLGGTLFGFTLFLQAHRDGRKGLRSLTLGVAGATMFAWFIGVVMGLDMRSVLAFWATALLEGGLWLLLSDLGYRFTHGRWLALRMPAAGGLAFLVATALYRILPLGIPPLSWLASLVAGVLLGLVALQQLVHLRANGIWVEGRGNGLRVALSALEGDQPPEGPALSYVIEARQPMFLVNEKGMLLETNTAFSRLLGLPRHQMKGYQFEDFFQGQTAPPWEDLRDQLLRDSRGSVKATLVRRDSSFQTTRLEAVAFDRNLALVWIADPLAGTLALRGESAESKSQPISLDKDPSRLAVDALAVILPAAEQILSETWNIHTREAAERIMLSAQRLLPQPGIPAGHPTSFPHLRARPVLEAMLPRIQRMLPAGFTLELRCPDLVLYVESDALQRMATQLVLHGRQSLAAGAIILVLTPITLGARNWARLTLQLAGPAGPGESEFLGLSWLQQSVRETLGMFETDRDPQGILWPRIYLPCESQVDDPGAHCLQDRSIWIFDQDPEVRATLTILVQEAGGQAESFASLRELLHAGHRRHPDLLVLERTEQLERYHNQLRRLRAGAAPGLILGDARALPHGEGAASRLMLLEKPFPGQNFLQCLLALLQSP